MRSRDIIPIIRKAAERCRHDIEIFKDSKNPIQVKMRQDAQAKLEAYEEVLDALENNNPLNLKIAAGVR